MSYSRGDSALEIGALYSPLTLPLSEKMLGRVVQLLGLHFVTGKMRQDIDRNSGDWERSRWELFGLVLQSQRAFDVNA